jgi:hypothetical protein
MYFDCETVNIPNRAATIEVSCCGYCYDIGYVIQQPWCLANCHKSDLASINCHKAEQEIQIAYDTQESGIKAVIFSLHRPSTL